MYIDKVRLTNIRGFRDLEFSFDRGDGTHAGWTVITGDNGSGKSTLLKALSISITGLQTAFALDPEFLWLQHGVSHGKISTQIVNDENKTVPHTILINSNKTRTSSGEFLRQAPAGEADGFSCGYGPFRRVSDSATEVQSLMAAPVTGRFVTMFRESASLAKADEWLRQLNYKRLEGRTTEAQELELVISILNDEFLPNQIEVDRIDSDGLWLKDRNGVELSWGNMSDGYRSALALLSDILRHLINHYGIGDLTARDAEGKLFVTRSGVVLIDEIDAHLHPEWQREIGFWLKKRFPNIQFIVTSHSPLICQAADPNGLFVLPEPGSDEPARALTPEEYQEVISSRPDTILRSAAFGLQNTRSPVAVEARSAYADLRTKQRAGGKLTKTELAELERLRQYINPDEEP
jgi:AAA domain, putative AbiEii toxin, Type IV TA system